MAVLRSVKLTGSVPKFAGFLRSSHALLGLIAILCTVFFAMAGNNPSIKIGAFVLFAVLVLVVVMRFALRGPEADRTQSNVTISHHEAQFGNVDIAQLGRPEFAEVLKLLAASRPPLPNPAGIVRGSSADIRDIEMLAPAQSETIGAEDNQRMASALVNDLDAAIRQAKTS